MQNLDKNSEEAKQLQNLIIALKSAKASTDSVQNQRVNRH